MKKKQKPPTVTFDLLLEYNDVIKRIAKERRVSKRIVLEEAIEYYLVEKHNYGK